jgi:hypothetical protein
LLFLKWALSFLSIGWSVVSAPAAIPTCPAGTDDSLGLIRMSMPFDVESFSQKQRTVEIACPALHSVGEGCGLL